MSRSGCFIAEEEYVEDILTWLIAREKCQEITPLRSPQLSRLLEDYDIGSIHVIIEGEDS